MFYRIKKLIVSSKIGDWCLREYPGHPKGCPNYGKKDGCPPGTGPDSLGCLFDLSKPLYFIHSEFDLAEHARRMKEKHPQWSDRQCRCVLYWQPASRKRLSTEVSVFMHKFGFNQYTTCPEGLGVNVYATARLAGLRLEKIRNISICRHVALVGLKAHRGGQS